MTRCDYNVAYLHSQGCYVGKGGHSLDTYVQSLILFLHMYLVTFQGSLFLWESKYVSDMYGYVSDYLKEYDLEIFFFYEVV